MAFPIRLRLKARLALAQESSEDFRSRDRHPGLVRHHSRETSYSLPLCAARARELECRQDDQDEREAASESSSHHGLNHILVRKAPFSTGRRLGSESPGISRRGRRLIFSFSRRYWLRRIGVKGRPGGHRLRSRPRIGWAWSGRRNPRSLGT